MKKASCNVLKLYHSVTHAFIIFDILIEMSLATANVDNILSRIFANIPRKKYDLRERKEHGDQEQSAKRNSMPIVSRGPERVSERSRCCKVSSNAIEGRNAWRRPTSRGTCRPVRRADPSRVEVSSPPPPGARSSGSAS